MNRNDEPDPSVQEPRRSRPRVGLVRIVLVFALGWLALNAITFVLGFVHRALVLLAVAVAVFVAVTLWRASNRPER